MVREGSGEEVSGTNYDALDTRIGAGVISTSFDSTYLGR